MKKYYLIGLSAIIIACGKGKNESHQNSSISSEKVTKIDSNTIDLVRLKANGVFKDTQQIEVKNDPVYHKNKKYNAVSLPKVFEQNPAIKKLNPLETKVVFECEDGYKPEMSLEKLLKVKSFLAISDLDAPKESDWEQIIKDGHKMKTAPFYVVYTNIDTQDGDYKWPYNLVKIHFLPLNQDKEKLFPKDKTVEIGYNLFKKHCQTCHSINQIGGTMGPELNIPKSVTEYWKEDYLIAFIQNPASFRKGIKMPTLGIKANEAKEIVNYLKYMASKK